MYRMGSMYGYRSFKNTKFLFHNNNNNNIYIIFKLKLFIRNIHFNIFIYKWIFHSTIFLLKYIRIKKLQQNNNNNNITTSTQHYTPITNNLFAQMQFCQHPQQHPQYVKPNNQSPSHLFGLSTSPSHLGPQFPPPTSSAPSTSSSTTSEEWIFGQRYLEI
ncbi:hypothetical protein DICPUDRAFT_85393 [Dictyostelium purpureum]|uniref:Uncharacterized protein n=1 Tax=Dictyostelium purpureum TaxID=5786 RepID=F1A5K9_DICPU|nr:uncharacterized protein DICPUDRAFT_85393 [Dictyostelium purpureum]EGC28518.1 hypothetical protein DICPUDRAFT_85393 [Dictyostelium purpureum]|eukprot:XP_003294953.1 hypothetical protein DICPUDRAFT_85393 [Dictyostelium purpureum]